MKSTFSFLRFFQNEVKTSISLKDFLFLIYHPLHAPEVWTFKFGTPCILHFYLVCFHFQAAKIFAEQLLELHRGQGMEIYWRDHFICPSEADYKTMIRKKTGGLFTLVVRLMQLFSSYKEDFSTLITNLGLYFQIRDDYCNLCLSEYTETKSYCEDLTEGKFSFPIIHALTTNPDDRQIRNILRQRPKEIEVKRHCVQLLEKFGSFEYTRRALEEWDAKTRIEIERLGGNPLLKKILDSLKNWN
ncbi:geranylgeranyl pyrophosphate synthase-like [Ooceraea biroi]|uniref:geranylgeranyl pyrophosphate synthase-like n=1 Tax=Ooceraea biroi TaxID=2015173 RepID=UPI000F093D66|nr:geranylgeranyl pyrophosphate synthase-like [Ooceraea biroi]